MTITSKKLKNFDIWIHKSTIRTCHFVEEVNCQIN